MTEPAAGPKRAVRTHPRRPSTALVVASFIPIGFAIVIALIAPGFYIALLDDRASIFGTAPIIPFAGALLVLLGIDLLVAWFVRSSFVQGIVLAVTTTAGVFLVILAPSMALIAINLGGVVD